MHVVCRLRILALISWVSLVTEKIGERNSPAIRQKLKLNVCGLRTKEVAY
jgi:hypothetical protein